MHLRTVVQVTDTDGRYTYSRLDKKSLLAKYDTPGFSYAGKYYRGGSYAGHASEVVPYCTREDHPSAPSATVTTPGR